MEATKKARTLGAYSRPHRLRILDGRTQEAAFLRQTRAKLIEHVGGSPSAVQLALIERAAMLTLRVAQIDVKANMLGLSDHDHRHYLAWNNSLTKTLERLGLDAAPKPRQSLEDIMEDIAARRDGGAVA